MPFLRPLDITAPNGNRDLPWPIDGVAYVVTFMCPILAGPMIGFLRRDWREMAIGLPAGLAIAFFNAWLNDRYVDAWIAKFQTPLQNRIPRILANLAAFAWALALSAISMLAPFAILGIK
jgi:hypothetical protein